MPASKYRPFAAPRSLHWEAAFFFAAGVLVTRQPVMFRFAILYKRSGSAAVTVNGCCIGIQQFFHHLLRYARNDRGHFARPTIMEEHQHFAGGVIEHQRILPGVQCVGQPAPAAVGVPVGAVQLTKAVIKGTCTNFSFHGGKFLSF